MLHIEKIIDLATGQENIIERNLNPEEVAELQEIINKSETEATQKAAKDAARQAVLDKLGLSADEVAALLG